MVHQALQEEEGEEGGRCLVARRHPCFWGRTAAVGEAVRLQVVPAGGTMICSSLRHPSAYRL